MGQVLGVRALGRGPAGLRAWVASCAWAVIIASATAGAADRPTPLDNWTFRPTVLVRKGTAQGSGTVIASVADETLVLTAAHVVAGPGRLAIELHRYNVGLERVRSRGGWPRTVPAEVVATDPPADVAIVRIRGMVALPYVARIAPPGAALEAGTVVTSVGIDEGAKLSSWMAHVVAVEQFEMEGMGAERPYVITTRPPEHGRSGGGLFLDDGTLVGVCVGRVQIIKGRRSGIFAAGASVHRLLRDNDLDGLVARSSRRIPFAPTRARP
jgi:S1-C subfamily serine protease